MPEPAAPPPPLGDRPWPLPAWRECAALAALPVLLYARALPFGLLDWDDRLYYLFNPALREGRAAGLLEIWQTPIESNYLPLTQLTWWLDLALFGHAGPWWGARLHSLAWFAAGVLAVRALVLRLTSRRGTAFCTAAFFAVHPLCAPSVLWLAERKNLVGLALMYWSLERYLAARAEANPRRALLLYAVAWGLFVLALLGKIHAVALPALLLAYEATLSAGPWRARLARVAPFAALAAAALALNLAWRQDLGLPFLGGSRAGALASTGPIVLSYLGQTVWPSGLALLYAYAEYAPDAPWGWAAWAGVGLAMACAIGLARERPLAAWCWLGGLCALLPALNFVPQAFPRADYYLQWALPCWLLGLCLAGEALVARLPAGAARRFGPAAAAAVGIAWGVSAYGRVPQFASDRALFRHAVEAQPESSTAWAQYARILQGEQDPAQAEQAQAAGRRALACPDARRLAPLDRVMAVRLAALELLGRGRGEEAWELARLELQSVGFLLYARVTLGEVGWRAGLPERALAALAPDFTPGHAAAAAALRARCRDGQVLPDALPPQLVLTLEPAEAVQREWLERVLREHLRLLAAAYVQAGDAERAFLAAAVLVNRWPEFQPGRETLAEVYARLGLPEAAAALRKDRAP